MPEADAAALIGDGEPDSETGPPRAAGLALLRLLSAEDIGRLRARFAEVTARLAVRVHDEARLENLRAEAEKLNPDTWVTADEVRQALEDYERVYHALREAIGPLPGGRRGRSRKRPSSDRGQPQPAIEPGGPVSAPEGRVPGGKGGRGRRGGSRPVAGEPEKA
jgi:hypothetical protein